MGSGYTPSQSTPPSTNGRSTRRTLRVSRLAPIKSHGTGGWASPQRHVNCATVSTSSLDLATTTDDCVVFTLFVEPATFERFAFKVAHGSLDEIVLTVGSVDGFYSEWSPSIFTRSVKVLTSGEEHGIVMPPGDAFEPRRLGDVGTAELRINRRLEFRTPASRPKSDDEAIDHEEARDLAEALGPSVVGDLRLLQALASLRRAAWLAVFLLALIVVAMLQR
jgi:hypothetical protein